MLDDLPLREEGIESATSLTMNVVFAGCKGRSWIVKPVLETLELIGRPRRGVEDFVKLAILNMELGRADANDWAFSQRI